MKAYKGKTYFQEKLKLANALLELIDERFDLSEEKDAVRVYYWILDIERLAKRIGMLFYSRQGRKTLIGILNRERMWLRANVYSSSSLSLDDLLDSRGRIKVQRTEERIIDLEEIILNVKCETKILRTLFVKFANKEEFIFNEFEKIARKEIKKLY